MRMRVHGPSALALVLAVLSCAGRDAQISCSPTPSCSSQPDRFDQPEDDNGDAGPRVCDAQRRRCRARQITTGAHHGCAIARAGELLCWGDNSQGQRGVIELRDAGLSEPPEPPEPPAGGGVEDARVRDRDAGLTPALKHVELAAAGGAHTCALVEGGVVQCWGRNLEGQVDGEPSNEPVRAPRELELPRATHVGAGGAHSCAVTSAGVLCWGDGRYGQSGREVREAAFEPGLVAGTEGVVEVACGARHSCALRADRSVLCWGELIDDAGQPRTTAQPELVPDLPDALEISAGAGHSCALRDGGHAVCWGRNDNAQLGDGTRRSSARPVSVRELEQSLHVAAGGLDEGGELIGHSCAQTKTFNMRCWGRNREGQLGNGTVTDSPVAVLVLDRPDQQNETTYLDDVVNVATGGRFSCNLDDDGPVYCWGDNRNGELGLFQNSQPVVGRPTPVRRFSFPE